EPLGLDPAARMRLDVIGSERQTGGYQDQRREYGGGERLQHGVAPSGRTAPGVKNRATPVPPKSGAAGWVGRDPVEQPREGAEPRPGPAGLARPFPGRP